MHLLNILPDRRSGNAAYHNQYWICIFWLVSEGLLHERKLLLNLPSDFGSPSQQVLLLPTRINSAIVIHHHITSLSFPEIPPSSLWQSVGAQTQSYLLAQFYSKIRAKKKKVILSYFVKSYLPHFVTQYFQ
jgi:hypothetical protein